MTRVREDTLVARYRANYGLPDSVPVTDATVLGHWQLERRLTQELLASTPQTRAATFERCYSELYGALPWLRQEGEAARATTAAEHGIWPLLIGPPPCEVYEVGSGDGSLARYLAGLGYTCRATEITSERGDRREQAGLSWGQTDGVNLDSFEAPGSFDAVISDQVLEHLHPDDLPTHLRAARALLRPGGRLAFGTPHAYTGPHDVSRVFDLEVAAGMHLHEYTYDELGRALQEAGFREVSAPLRLPVSLRARLSGHPRPRVSEAYFRYLVALERPLRRLTPRTRRTAARALRTCLFADNLMLVARTPA